MHQLRNLLCGKFSSILIFEIIKMSTLKCLTCSARNSNLFLIEFIFKCTKISLFMLSLRIFFSVVSQSLYILAESVLLNTYSGNHVTRFLVDTLDYLLNWQFVEIIYLLAKSFVPMCKM